MRDKFFLHNAVNRYFVLIMPIIKPNNTAAIRLIIFGFIAKAVFNNMKLLTDKAITPESQTVIANSLSFDFDIVNDDVIIKKVENLIYL